MSKKIYLSNDKINKSPFLLLIFYSIYKRIAVGMVDKTIIETKKPSKQNTVVFSDEETLFVDFIVKDLNFGYEDKFNKNFWVSSDLLKKIQNIEEKYLIVSFYYEDLENNPIAELRMILEKRK